MEENWQKIYSSSFEHKIEFVQAVLEDEGITSVIINKKDSAYLFGELELYVHADNVMKAKQVIIKGSL